MSTISSDKLRCEVYFDLKLYEAPWSEFANKKPSSASESSSKAASLGDVLAGHKEGKRDIVMHMYNIILQP